MITRMPSPPPQQIVNVLFVCFYLSLSGKSEMTGPARHIGYRHMHQRLRMRHDLPVKRLPFLFSILVSTNFAQVLTFETVFSPISMRGIHPLHWNGQLLYYHCNNKHNVSRGLIKYFYC